MKRLAAALAVLLLAACAPVANGPGPGAPGDPTFSATLERTACFGTCPIYRVTITADGKVVFEGIRFVAAVGRREGQADPAKLAALIALVDSSRFMSLKPQYRAQVTDLPSQVVTITRNGRIHRVEDYAGRAVGMPEDVARLEALIDEAAKDGPWVGDRELFTGAPR